MFGYNPELSELAHRLSGEITHMPTCAVAEFTFDARGQKSAGSSPQRYCSIIRRNRRAKRCLGHCDKPMCNGRPTGNSNTRDDCTGGCFRNLLLVTGPQLVFAPILSYVELLKL